MVVSTVVIVVGDVKDRTETATGPTRRDLDLDDLRSSRCGRGLSDMAMTTCDDLHHQASFKMKHQDQTSQRFRSLQTEASRERDVFRHLHPWTHEFRCTALHRNAFPGGASGEASAPMTMAEAEPCPDTALIAFASLVCHRLAARRCFVNLLSTSSEYILAEASRSTSLQYNSVEDVAKDTPWLGTCSFLREEGMASSAMDGWRRARSGREAPTEDGYYYQQGMSPHWHIISDVRGSQQTHHGFLRCSPWTVRFYAAVPLRSATGSVLGCLTIVDDAPRYGLSAGELSFMEDISDTICQHLDAVVVRSQRRRSERLIQSLGLFNNGKSSLRQWWLNQETSRIATAGRHAKQRTEQASKDAADAEFGTNVSSSSLTGPSSAHDEVASNVDSDSEMDEGDGDGDPVTATASTLRNDVAGVARKEAKVSTQDFGASKDTPRAPMSKLLLEPSSGRHGKRRKLNSGMPDGSNFDLEAASRHTYSRASQLIRQALGADGVVFLNATAAHSKKRHDIVPSLKHESSDASSHSQPRSLSDNETSEASASSNDRHCLIEAFSTRDLSSLHHEDTAYRFDISESFLASLIRRNPNGKIFNFCRDGACYSSSGEDNSASGSNSESHAKNFRTPRDGRRLGKVMVGAKTIAFFPLWDEAQDRWSSGMFVWCTTPLRFFQPAEDIIYLASWSHSIIAELGRLQTLAADRAKSTFISSISHELRTPLHGVLASVEFLEETELTAFQGEMSNTIGMAGKALLATIDNVLDYAKISSFTRAQNRQRQGADALNYTTNDSKVDSAEMGVTANVDLALLTEEVVETVVNAYRFRKTRMESPSVPSVAINIGRRSNWMVKIQPGSWTRILSNLVGNALKYTPAGLIAVRLDTREHVTDGSSIEHIRLEVQDTGIGMTQQFQRQLYTPFKQANSHASGTGLGLSIVRRICKDSGAHLNITSKLGEGTCATVDLQAHFIAGSVASAVPSLKVDCFHLFTPTKEAHLSPRSVAPSVVQAARDWLDCEVSKGPTSDKDGGSVVYAIAEEDLSTWASQGTPRWKGKIPSHVLVLGSSMRSVTFEAPSQELPFVPLFVHQPIGPQKLLRAIRNDQSSTGMISTHPRRHTASLLEYGAAGADRPPSMDRMPAEFFPWNKKPRLGRKSSVPGISTDQSAASSAAFSAGPPSVLNSATTERSNSIDSTAWHEHTGGNGARDTVLLVEDNEVNLKLLMALMRKLKYNFLCAVNGREAVNIYRDRAPSILLVLMDVSMPVMDGLTATVKIRETEHKRKLPRCHIAALTGVTSEDAQQQAFTSGVDDFYSKPVGMKEVKELLRKLEVGNDSKS